MHRPTGSISHRVTNVLPHNRRRQAGGEADEDYEDAPMSSNAIDK